MDYRCPDCGSIDLDLGLTSEFECQECGWEGNFDDLNGVRDEH